MRISVPQIAPPQFYYDRLVEVVKIVDEKTSGIFGGFTLGGDYNLDPNYYYVLRHISMINNSASNIIVWYGQIHYYHNGVLYRYALPFRSFEGLTIGLHSVDSYHCEIYLPPAFTIFIMGRLEFEGDLARMEVYIDKLRR